MLSILHDNVFSRQIVLVWLLIDCPIKHFFPLAPKYIKMFALDEADEMLSRGFKDQIYDIFQKLSTDIQVKCHVLTVYRYLYKIFTLCYALLAKDPSPPSHLCC